jgi:hypothetical protein
MVVLVAPKGLPSMIAINEHIIAKALIVSFLIR